jgi:integrase
MKANLTDRTLGALKRKPAEPGKRYDLWDMSQAGFGVRVNDKGHCVFMVAKRLAGKKHPTRFTVGPYPSLSLAAARKKARGLISDLEEGISPREKEEAREREEVRRRQDTFAAVAEAFIEKHVSKLRTGDNVQATIRRELIGRWGERPIADIRRRDVTLMLEETVERGSPYTAYHLLAYCRKLWNWAIARELYGLETSPCDRISPKDLIGPREPRQRVLTDDEIRLVWKATAWSPNEPGGLGYPIAPLVRALLITGQRLREVAEAQWSEIDVDAALWVIPPERMKGRAAHEIPLSPMAVDLLKSLPRFSEGDFVFTTTGGARPVSGFSKFKRRTDAAISKLAGKPIAGWRFHDLRRTMRTHLSALPSVPDMVRELVIGHARPGLHQVYDQHTYRDEKRSALDQWAARLGSILEPETGNVIHLRTSHAAATA